MKSDYRLVKTEVHEDSSKSTVYSINKTYYHTDGGYFRHDRMPPRVEADSIENLQNLLKQMLEGTQQPVAAELGMSRINTKEQQKKREEANKKVKKKTLDLMKLANSLRGLKDYGKTLGMIEEFAAKEKLELVDYVLQILDRHIMQVRLDALKEKEEKPITCVEVMADYGHGLWRLDGKYLGAPLEANRFGDKAFVEEFQKWLIEYNKNGSFDWDYVSFNETGLKLARKIKDDHPELTVVYHPVGRNDKFFDKFTVTGSLRRTNNLT